MRAAVLSLAIVLSGCFTYAQVEPGALPRGAELVATLNDPVDARVGEVTVHGVTLVEGTASYADGDSLVMSGRRFLSQSGIEYASFGSPVSIPRSRIGTLREKRVSGWKTAVVVGASGAALAAIVASVGPLAGSSGGSRPKPQP